MMVTLRLSENDYLELFIWIPDTFPSNYSYTLLEEARKVPSTAVCGQVGNDKDFGRPHILVYRQMSDHQSLHRLFTHCFR